LVALSEFTDLPLSRRPQLDSLEYLRWAEQIAAADGRIWVEYPEHAPGYPLFLGALLALGGSLTTIRATQAVIGSVSCVITARIAGRTLSPGAFLPAGLLQATYAPLIYLDTALLAEPLLIMFLLLAVDRVTSAATDRRSWFISGLALGVAAVIRPTALVLAPAFILATRMRNGSLVAALLAGIAVPVTPVVLQNWRISGVPLIQAYGVMNFYLGNTIASDGAARARPGGWWDALEAEASRAGVSRNEQDRYYVVRAIREIASSPGEYARLLLNKLAWMTQQEELRDTHSLHFFRAYAPWLMWLPGFGLALSLAAVAMLAVRTSKEPAWICWSLIWLSATVLFFVVGLRYRAPLVPLVVALAGFGVATLSTWIRLRRWKLVAAAALVGTVVFAGANLRTDDHSRNLAEEWALTGLSLQQEGSIAASADAYRRALAFDDRSSLAWDGLGVVLRSQGQEAAARDAFERAVQANDQYALAWYHVASARDQAGDVAGAILAFRRALAIAPERTDLVLAFGLTLHRERRLDEAEPLLLKAAARGEGRAHVALALSAIERRDVAQARHHAQEAVRLLPNDDRARELWRALSQ
jgi:Tfp pilus assembly protein PilF